MVSSLTSIQKLILVELVRASGFIYIFTIAKRLHIDIYTVTVSIKKLIRLDYVKEDTDNGLRVKVTPDGRQWLLENSSYLLNKERSWRAIPTSFTQPQISPNDFYIPVPRCLDKKFFKKYSKKGGKKAGG